MRGENPHAVFYITSRRGTSPRARGKPVRGDCSGVGIGNIPACAGKTSRGYLGLRTRNGTSPRARGKRARHSLGHRTHGNIPACAGKTATLVLEPDNPQEHPRVRGENFCTDNFGVQRQGTSPRARGKRLASLPCRRGKRNIPACAGKTGSPKRPATTHEEHPRVRGENPGRRLGWA